MEITDIKTYPMWIPLKETEPLSAYPKRRSVHILIEVSTDEGIKGYGESIPYTYDAVGARAQLGTSSRQPPQ